jgi:hypothetical protein
LNNYINNQTDNTNGENLVIDYSEGEEICFCEDKVSNKTYSYYLLPVCALHIPTQFEKSE